MNSIPKMGWFQSSWYVTVPSARSETGKRYHHLIAEGTQEQREARRTGQKLHCPQNCTIEQLQAYDAFRQAYLNSDDFAEREDPNGNSVSAVVARYLRDGINKKRKDLKTVRGFLASFVLHFGQKTVADLSADSVSEWFQKETGWLSAAHRNNALKALRQAFTWAVEQSLISSSPIAGRKQEKTGRTSRDYQITAADDAAVSQHASEALQFVWNFCRSTGCRPGEACVIEAYMVRQRDSGSLCIELPDHKTNRYGKRRIIEVIDPIAALNIRTLCAKYPTGKLFRSPRGKAWTSENLGKALRVLKKNGVVDKKCVMYSNRHSDISSQVADGIPVEVIAELHGTSVKMIRANYLHLDGDIMRQRIVDQYFGGKQAS